MKAAVVGAYQTRTDYAIGCDGVIWRLEQTNAPAAGTAHAGTEHTLDLYRPPAAAVAIALALRSREARHGGAESAR